MLFGVDITVSILILMKGANIVVNALRISSLNLLQISKTFAFPLI